MSEQKQRYFQRQANRIGKTAPRRELYQSGLVTNSFSLSQTQKQENVSQGSVDKKIQMIAEQKTLYSLTTNAQESLRKCLSCSKTNLQSLIQNKSLRAQMKKQQKRLTKIRMQNKLTVQTDTELSLLAINILLASTEEFINQINQQKSEKSVTKSTVRINQQKEINKHLSTIDEQIQICNFASVKSTIQTLLKKYGKDQLVQDRLGLFNFILALNDEYERQATILKEMTSYLQKLGSVDIAPQNINASVLTLKNIKKQTNLSLIKENKKLGPSEKLINVINQVDKIGTSLASYVDLKVQKKIEAKTKREIELQKQLLQKSKANQFLSQYSRYCQDLLQKFAQNKDQIFKQLQLLKKNKKKSSESPYNFILKLNDIISINKRQINQTNIYFKAIGQLHLRKNLNSENLLVQIKKIEQKYLANQLLQAIKPNLQLLINNIQQRQRFSKQQSALEQDLKKSRLQIQKLEKIIQEQKNRVVETVAAQSQKIDKKKQLEEKRAKQAERLKQQKQQKELQRNLDNIYSNLLQRKWKVAKNLINLFVKKYQESTSSNILRSLQGLNTVLTLLQDLQTQQNKAVQGEKREKANLFNYEKEKQTLSQKNKSLEQYELSVRSLLQNFNQQGFNAKKYFEEIRKDRKKIVQQKYQLINKLQQLIIAYRIKKQPQISQNKNVTLSLSLSQYNQFEKIKQEREELNANLNKEKQKNSMLESRLKDNKNPDVSKDADELLSLVKKIEKGGEWWKFLPKNLKNSTFKQIYTLLQKYRENELAIQRYIVNEELFKEQGETVNSAIDSCVAFIQSSSWYSQQSWENRLANYRGNISCDKLILCLRQLTNKANLKMEEEKQNYTIATNTLEAQIQRLNKVINDLQRKKDTNTEKSYSRQEESSSKKSIDLKSSRKMSKSRQKQSQIKDAMQEYVKQEKNMLNKIQQLQTDKNSLSSKITTLQNQINQLERNLEDQRIQFEKTKFAGESFRLQQLQRINILTGQVEISEGRIIELQSELSSSNQLQKELTSKLQSYQQREQEYDHLLKQNQQKANNQAQNRLSTELNYYRQMYAELSKDLQQTKQRQQHISKDFEALQKNHEILQKKYQADIGLNESTTYHVDVKQQQLKMKPYKINLNSSKVVDLYLDQQHSHSTPIRSKKVEQKHSHVQSSQNILLKQQIQRLKNQLSDLQVQKVIQIQSQVIRALKNQEADFNQFLRRFEAEKFEYFMNNILPIKLEEEMSKRNVPNTQLIFAQWIASEFPKLYQEKHSRQCQNSIIQMQLSIKNRVEVALRQRKLDQEKQLQERIQKSLFDFQQNTIPIIIQQNKQQWQSQKQKQWGIKLIEVQQYWRNILQNQKAQLINNQANSIQTILHQKEQDPLRKTPSQQIQKGSNKEDFEKLLEQHLQQWQAKKSNEWAIQSRQIENYWATVIIPEKLKQWQVQKEKEFEAVMQTWIQQNNQEWQNRLQQTRIKANQAPANQLKNQFNELQIIEQWKQVHLPPIIEGQVKFAIQSFIQIDLPKILEHQKRNWLALQQFDLLLNQQYKRWEQQKNLDIALITQSFEAKINQILQIEHAEWQRIKTIEIQKILEEQHNNWNKSQPNIEEIVQNEQKHWELVKLEQIRSIQLQFQTRLNQIQRKLNSQIIDYQEKFLKEQSRISEAENTAIIRWKNNELPILLAKERQIWISEWKTKELPKILQQKYRQWETVDLVQLIQSDKCKYIVQRIVAQRFVQWQREKNNANNLLVIKNKQFYEKELVKQKQEWEAEKSILLTTYSTNNQTQQIIKAEQYALWQKKKQEQWELRVKQIQNYWVQNILPQKEQQWRRQQLLIVDQVIKNKIVQVQAAYQEEIIPNIIKEEQLRWETSQTYLIQKEKELWINDLPNLLSTGRYNQFIQPLLESQASQYQMKVKKILAEAASSNLKIQQLLNQIVDYQNKLRENRSKIELSQNKVTSLLTEQEVTIKRTLEQSQRLNDELTRSRWAEKEVQQLRKIIALQKGQISKLTNTVRQSEKLRLQNLNLQEANSNLQKSKWQEINAMRVSYQTKIVQITTERNSLQSRAIQIQSAKKQTSQKEAIQSLQRQILTLTSTIKTKDAEIVFLKKTIENVNHQIRENRQKLNEQLQRRGNDERIINQLKSSKLQYEYQIKYLKDREQSLTKKIELKEQEMINISKRVEFQNNSLEKKLKNSLEYVSNLQAKYNEIDSLLSLKTKEYHSLFTEADRLRYENQSISANNQLLLSEKESFRRQLRQFQSAKQRLQIQRQRYLQDINRYKANLLQKTEDSRAQNQNKSHLIAQINNEKARFQDYVKQTRQQILYLQIELRQSQKGKRLQAERADKLQRQLAEGSRQAQLNEIQVLKKINRDVTDITATNRQLQMKCLLLQNREKITSNSSQAINSFLLIQKHTDILIDYLLKESIVPNLQVYHKFVQETRISLSAGRTLQYFQLWQRLMKDLFQLTLSSRAEQMRAQAEELLRLRDEMTDVLERQIEASQGDQSQLVQDYKVVLNDIKSLVRQYVRSNDEEYIRLLCDSLGIKS